MSDPRKALEDARRVVIMVGSRALVENRERFAKLTSTIHSAREDREFARFLVESESGR